MEPCVFPSSIDKVGIFNASFGTRELGPALLSAIRSVYHHPELVTLVSTLEPDRDDIVYIVICPAGLWTPSNSSAAPTYYITWQLEFWRAECCTSAPNPYLDKLRGALYNWEYSEYNIQTVKKHYALESIHVIPGFNETISTHDILTGSYLYTDSGKDIDILFLGYCDAYPRRVALRNECRKRGFTMWFVANLDLNGMKQAIRRSKICINVSTFDPFILHTIRMNILLSNQACIVSERTIDESTTSVYAQSGMLFVPYEEILDTCKMLIDDVEQRRKIAVQSFQWYRNERLWTDIVDFTKLLP